MSAPSSQLAGLSRWVTRPSAIAAGVGALLGVAYGHLTLQFPASSFSSFLGISIVVVALSLFVGLSYSARGMATLRGVSSGMLQASRENLMASVREVRGAPDRSFILVLGFWLGST